jgi:Raf kinase inhibitor-like YbhB/YbcL family protein
MPAGAILCYPCPVRILKEESAMQIWSDSFKNGDPIPSEFAFGTIDPKTRVALAANRNPHLAWSDVPAETQSFALICHDPDVPSNGDDVNHADRQVPEDLPRVDFFHWVLINLPASVQSIAAGEYSDGVTARGKAGPDIPGKTARQGLNDYTVWFASDQDMGGDYFGYDGPCPPWNDMRVHRYIFTLYALDAPQVDVGGKFTGQQVRDAIRGHILAEASIMGTYTLNPALAKQDA